MIRIGHTELYCDLQPHPLIVLDEQGRDVIPKSIKHDSNPLSGHGLFSNRQFIQG